ncbi:MAG TPA: DnaB-like helicase C-terminal domain-containing protein [Terriglobales bacterium]|jgi:replicative DNA helicase|nr:DnaB-like helicase C-terminal domain-containing protein [Terriglobales bacterium]
MTENIVALAERAVLGSCLVDPNAIYRVLPILNAEAFDDVRHRQIFSCLRYLADQGTAIDTLAVTSALARNKKLESSAGGVAYLTDLGTGVTVANVERHAQQVIDAYRRRQARVVGERLLAQCDDPTVSTEDCLSTADEDLLAIAGEAQRGSAIPLAQLLVPTVDSILKPPAGEAISTGIKTLDEHTAGGIRRGELWCLAGRTGAGKTSCAVQILHHAIHEGIPTLMYSLEMSSEEITKRLLSLESGVDAWKIRQQTVTADELMPAVEKLGKLPLLVDDSASLGLSELVARVRLHVRRDKVKFVVVDYLRLIRSPGDNLREQVSNAADGLRRLAKTENIAILMLSQLRRPESASGTSRPELMQLKESGDIENHVHTCLLVHQPVDKDGHRTHNDELIIAKQRHGRIGPIPMHFNSRLLKYEERAR